MRRGTMGTARERTDHFTHSSSGQWVISVAEAETLSAVELSRYHDEGFIIRRGVFPAGEMAAFATDTERLLSERRDLIDRRNLRCRFMPHVETGEPIFEVFDPVIDVSPVAAQFATDVRLLSMIESIYGEPASLFKEKLIFKPSGAKGYNLHQDIPRQWAGFPRTFLTVLIPIDAATHENGCTQVFTGYHHSFIEVGDPNVYMLPDDCVDPGRRVNLLLSPGDVAIFHGLTPHCSGPNLSAGLRRGFYVSYNALSDGGDQRAAHYAKFQESMRPRLCPEAPETVYFR